MIELGNYYIDFDKHGNGWVVNEVAGENLGSHKLVYRNASGTWSLADADSLAYTPALGITMGAIASGKKGEILLWGYIGDNSWTWTAGEEIYVSTVAGELTQTSPSGFGDVIQVVASAIEPTLIQFSGSINGSSDIYGDKVTEASYIVFTDGTTIYAKNGMTGQIEYSSTSPLTVLKATSDAASGGSMYIKSGYYPLSSLWDITTPVKIFGDGIGTQIDITTGFLLDHMIRISSDNVELHGIFLNITREKEGGGGINGIMSAIGIFENVIIENCFFQGQIISGTPYPNDATDCTLLKVIETGEGKNWKIINNDFYMFGYEAVTVALNNPPDEYGDTIIITDNYIKGGYGGVAIEGYSQYCDVSNNAMELQLDDGTAYGVLLCQGAHHNTVSGNTINVTKALVWIRDESSYNTISNNNGRSIRGFLLDDEATNNKIIGNTVIRQPFESGVQVGQGFEITINAKNNEIIDNTFIGFGTYSFSVYAPTRIIGNTFRNCFIGALWVGSAGTLVEDNLFDGLYGYTLSRNIYTYETSTTVQTVIQHNTFRDYDDQYASTLAAATAAGATQITVASAVGIEVGAGITTTPTGFGAENHIIYDIDRTSNIITLTTPLTNNHLLGDPIVGFSNTRSIVYEMAIGNIRLHDNNIQGASYTIPFNMIANSIAKLDTIPLPFVDGTTFLSTAPFGWEIDANTEYAIAIGKLPSKVNCVYRWRIWAVSLVAEADSMRLEITGYGGTDNQVYTTETVAVADKPSTSVNFGVNDYIYWTLTATDDTDIDDMQGGDAIMIKVLHEAAGGADCETDAAFLCIEIEYV